MRKSIQQGEKYNRLTAIKFAKRKYCKNGTRIYWLFQCDCGNKKVIEIGSVKNGKSKSCGCLNKELVKKRQETHKMTGTKEFNAYRAMRGRCLNKNDKRYKDYGGRGIKICEEWLSKNGFQNFYKDMGKGLKNKSLDRIDNNDNYYKKNCRWATVKEQQNNTRYNVLLTYKEKTQTIAQWSEELNINYNTIMIRIKRKWLVEDILRIQLNKHRKLK